MGALIRQYQRTFLWATAAGTALRLLFVLRYPNLGGDSLIYSDIAHNWLRHGMFALTESGVPVPTLIRLPGYPAFLAALFLLFREENVRAVLLVQSFIDIGSCFIIAAIALELFSAKIARNAFVVAAVCPFTANYVALPLTETLAIFFTALSLLLLLKGLSASKQGHFSPWMWASCGLSLGAGILLRPDGGILLAAIVAYLLCRSLRQGAKYFVPALLIVTTVALAPLIPWTARNWHVFHVFQPLAPRYANAQDEYVPSGFNRWVKTWLAEYVSVEDVFWNVSTETPGEKIDVDSLPTRAYDSPEERTITIQLFDEFNQTLILSPETDRKFAALAAQRIGHAPLRFYLWLPALRVADMWLRPRTEMLPIDPRWWTFDDPEESIFAIAYGVLNLFLLLAALIGLVRFRSIPSFGLLIGFILMRSIFLATMENPEPRYMLECFPIVLALAAATLTRSKDGHSS